jgi:hypothetical protein
MSEQIKATADRISRVVRLDLEGVLPQFLDMVADAYGADPDEVGQRLMDLAVRRMQLADTQQGAERRDTPDCVIEHAGAAVDAAREALTDAVSTEYLTVDLAYGAAREFAGEVWEATGEIVPLVRDDTEQDAA